MQVNVDLYFLILFFPNSFNASRHIDVYPHYLVSVCHALVLDVLYYMHNCLARPLKKKLTRKHDCNGRLFS